MKKLDITPLQKEQAKILRARGMGYGTIATVTGLKKDAARYACRDIEAPQEDNGLLERMQNGKACLYCGADLPHQEGVGRKAHYCGNECRREYWRIHRSEVQKRPKSIYTHTCAYCGKTFEVYGTRERKYCNRHCFMLHRNGHKLPESDAL